MPKKKGKRRPRLTSLATYSGVASADIRTIKHLQLTPTQIDALVTALGNRLKNLGDTCRDTAPTMRVSRAKAAPIGEPPSEPPPGCVLISTQIVWVSGESGGTWVTIDTYQCPDGTTYTVEY